MIALAVDTALAAVCVALVDEGRTLARRTEPMARGHQERLASLVRELLVETATPAARVGRVGVVVGPGSFTGVRVGVGFAKGFALGLGVPCLGLTSLEALWLSSGADRPVACAIDAGRGRVYFQAFAPGAPAGAGESLLVSEANERIARRKAGVALIGPGAALLDGGLATGAPILADPIAVARFALWASPEANPPRPLYLRPPDARTLAERAAS